jgi:hypothetical protein
VRISTGGAGASGRRPSGRDGKATGSAGGFARLVGFWNWENVGRAAGETALVEPNPLLFWGHALTHDTTSRVPASAARSRDFFLKFL